MSNAERFLNAYAAIEQKLQKMLDLKEHRRFSDMLDMGSRINPVVSCFKFDLKEYRDLRNAIVHDRADGKIIAEPNDETVASIEKIAGLLLEPPKVLPVFKKNVAVILAEEPLAKAIGTMSRLAYSQLPVVEHETVVAMLTSNMIIRWLGKNLPMASLDLKQILVSDLLRHTVQEDNFKVISAEASLFEALDLFCHYQAKKKKLEAILITRHGHPGEPLLGIITNRDLPLIQRELTNFCGKPE